MSHGFLPRQDNALLAWARNFSQRLTASPGTWDVSPEQAAEVSNATGAYDAALSQCDPNIRNKVSVVAKEAARTDLRRRAGSLGKTIQAKLNIADDLKVQIGLTVPGVRSKTPPPALPPVMQIDSVRNTKVFLVLRAGGEETARGKPRHVRGGLVFTYVGEMPPADVAEWRFHSIVSKTKLSIAFPPTLPPGAKVWLSAMWFSHRMQTGPMSVPVCTNLQGGGVDASTGIRMAA